MTDERSEFGSGLVVCLAKFSEHLHNHMFETVRRLHWWQGLSSRERAEKRAEALEYPTGDAARAMASAELGASFGRTEEEALGNAIWMWMNGASDHFYDLDRDHAPKPLADLADLALSIGHGYSGATDQWTWEHVARILELWEAACLALDEKLGLKPDWGQW